MFCKKNPYILWFIVDNECYILWYRWSILWSMCDKEIGCHGLILRNSKWNQKYHLLKLSWQNWIENCGDEQNLLLMKLTNVFISFFNSTYNIGPTLPNYEVFHFIFIIMKYIVCTRPFHTSSDLPGDLTTSSCGQISWWKNFLAIYIGSYSSTRPA